MNKKIYRKLMALSLTGCLALSIAACGNKEEEVYYFEDDEIAAESEEVVEEELTDEAGEYSEEYAEEYYYDENGELVFLDNEDDGSDGTIDYNCEDLGVTFHLTQDFYETKGLVDFTCRDVTGGEGVFYAEMSYFGMTYDELEAMLYDDEFSDEEAEEVAKATVPLFLIFAGTQNRSAKEIAELVDVYEEKNFTENDLALLQTISDCSFYECQLGEVANYNNLKDEYKEEYEKLLSLKNDLIANATFKRPITDYERSIGNVISFTTKDMDGNTVTSEEIFGSHDVTMVNVWGTWCGWCVGELPELEKINKKLEAKNCAIVGLCGDAYSDETIKEAKSILRDCGVTYYNILPFDGWEEAFEMNGWPTSFFIGPDGKILASPISGAKVAKYEPYIDDILAGKIVTGVPATYSYTNDASAYRIYVVDESSNPVEGAMVQFCTEDTCKMGVTDSSGIATFNDPPGVYDVHILKVPDGYKDHKDEYKTENTYSDLVIVLNKK